MHLMFVADVGRMMNADASALAALTILALGTFTAGVHIMAWRICLIGGLLALGVPAIAWPLWSAVASVARHRFGFDSSNASSIEKASTTLECGGKRSATPLWIFRLADQLTS